MNKDFLEYIFIIYLAMLFHTVTVDYFTRGGKIGFLQGLSLAFYGVHVPYKNRPVETYDDFPIEYYHPYDCPPTISTHRPPQQQVFVEGPGFMPRYTREFQYDTPNHNTSMTHGRVVEKPLPRPVYADPMQAGAPLISPAFTSSQAIQPTNIYPSDGASGMLDQNFASFIPN